MKNTNPVWYVVIALTIWCTWNSVRSSNSFIALSRVSDEVSIMTREVGYLMDRIQALESIEPEVIVKEVKVEVPVEVIKEVEIIKEVMIKDTTEVDNDEK